MKLFDLSGLSAVVTGGAGILGRTISLALAEAGARVIVASRNHAACLRAAEVLQALGYPASADVYDQQDEASILALASRHPDIDILVNNSVSRPMLRFEDPVERWRQSMEVNSTGLFTLSRAILVSMMSRGQGSIINVGSIQSVAGPDFQNYAGTGMTTPPDYHFHKHGLLGLTKYLAAIGGPRGVRVNALCPGGFENEKISSSFRESYCRRVYLGRLARYEEIKGAVVFLASPASSYVTGQSLVVDGGYTV